MIFSNIISQTLDTAKLPVLIIPLACSRVFSCCRHKFLPLLAHTSFKNVYYTTFLQVVIIGCIQMALIPNSCLLNVAIALLLLIRGQARGPKQLGHQRGLYPYSRNPIKLINHQPILLWSFLDFMFDEIQN